MTACGKILLFILVTYRLVMYTVYKQKERQREKEIDYVDQRLVSGREKGWGLEVVFVKERQRDDVLKWDRS